MTGNCPLMVLSPWGVGSKWWFFCCWWCYIAWRRKISTPFRPPILICEMRTDLFPLGIRQHNRISPDRYLSWRFLGWQYESWEMSCKSHASNHVLNKRWFNVITFKISVWFLQLFLPRSRRFWVIIFIFNHISHFNVACCWQQAACCLLNYR